MKREIIIICAIIFIIIIANTISQITSQKFFKGISGELDNLEQKIYAKDLENDNLSKEIDDIQNKWSEEYKHYACFIEHDELEKVYTQLVSIDANISVEDYNKAVDEIERCKFILRHIQEKDALKLVNIL